MLLTSQSKERAVPQAVGLSGSAGKPSGGSLDETLLREGVGPSGDALRKSMIFVTMGWFFGSVWITAISGTPMTLFVRNLGATNFELGVLSALPFIASFFSLPFSWLIERSGERKRIFLAGLYFQRLLWVPIAILPVWMIHRYGWTAAGPALTIFLILLFFMHLGQALGGPAWTSWMSDLVPDRIRGRYFCRRRQIGILSAIPAAILVGYYLDRYRGADPLVTLGVISIIFLIACVFGTADIALFHAVPNIPKKPQTGSHLVRSMSEPLKNRQFLWFAGFVGLMTFAVASQGQFVTLYLTEKLAIGSAKTQFMLLVTPMLAQLLMLPVWGKMADRVGKKPMMAIGALGLFPVGLSWVFVTSGSVWLGYIASAAGAALWTAFEVANFNFVLEMAGTEENGRKGGTAYVAVNSVIINIAGCLGGLAFGALAQVLRDWQWQPIDSLRALNFYDVLFILSAVLRLVAAVALLPMIHEPAAKPTHEALRFMTANIYNNLFSAILLPLRVMRITSKETYPGRDELG